MVLSGQYEDRLRSKLDKFPDNAYFAYIRDIPEPDLESRILVEIPAYCDPEVLPTMRAALAMAANPERIHFAVCYQGDDDAEASEVAAMPHTKVKRFHDADAPGLCAARYEAAMLRDGEEYVMHVDSHMRFGSFWDVCVIDQYSRCPSEKKVLTEYNLNYVEAVTEPVDSDWFDAHTRLDGQKVCFNYFEGGIRKARFTGRPFFNGPNPSIGAFICGHFVFGGADIDEVVPPDPNMFFVADEPCIALRFWTHGYDIYHPGARAVYHLYARDKALSDAGVTKGVQRFSLKSSESSKRSASELARMMMLFTDGLNPALGEYSLGTERTSKEYYAYSGLDYRSMLARRYALDCKFGVEHDDADMAPVCLHGSSVIEAKHPMYGVCLHGVHRAVIFVIVTAYKAKNELVETVRSLYDNADNPERVRVCVVAQLTEDKWLDAVREMGAEVVPCEPKGAGNAHYVGEEHIPDDAAYVLYSEEHMYYVYGWDTAIASYMRYCGENAVISDWASGFQYDKPFPTDPVKGLVICAKGMMPYGHPLIQFGRYFDVDRPVRGAFIIGHNVIVPARVAREIRHSPDMFLNSNESYMNYRYWCAGIDVYHAPYRYCYHYYATERNGGGDRTRSMETGFSAPRMRYLLGLSKDNPGADMRFALGHSRTLKAFAAFSGADPFTGKCSLRAQLGTFADDTCTDIIDNPSVNCGTDSKRWADSVNKSVGIAMARTDMFLKMDRNALEAFFGNNGALIGVWPTGKIVSNGGCIFGLPGTKLSVTSDARINMYPNSRIFVVGDMTLGKNVVVNVYPNATLVFGLGYLNSNCVLECWKRLNIIDTIVGPNTYLCDGYACDAVTADGSVCMPTDDVNVGPHVWLASGVTVMPGTKMLDAAAGAMTRVEGPVGPAELVAGNPGRIVKTGVHWFG